MCKVKLHDKFLLILIVLRLFLLYVQFRAGAMVSGKIGVLSAVQTYGTTINSFDKHVIRAINILRFVA